MQRVGDRWSFTGAKITMPRTYAAAEVPPGGWAAHPAISRHCCPEYRFTRDA
ncbi:hypothetical protein ACQPYE_21725 [Actinosynnema sp. CA-299493]